MCQVFERTVQSIAEDSFCSVPNLQSIRIKGHSMFLVAHSQRRATHFFYLGVVLVIALLPTSLLGQNQTVGSGDWFNVLNWLDEFGNKDHPEQGDNHTNTNISGGHTIQIFSGLATTDGNLNIGDIGGGTVGSGTLEILGSASYDSGGVGLIRIGGSAGTTGRLLIDTTGQVNGVFRVGQNSSSEALLELNNGTINGPIQLGFIGSGRLEMNGGLITGGGFIDPLSIRNGGIFNQHDGLVNISGETTIIEASGTYNIFGGGAQMSNLEMEGGTLRVVANGAGPANLDISEILLVRSRIAGGNITHNVLFEIGDGANINVNAGFLALDAGASTNMTGGILNATGSLGELIVEDGTFTAVSGQVNTQQDFSVQGGNQANLAEVMFLGNTDVNIGDALAIGLSNGGNASVTIDDNSTVNSSSVQIGNAGNFAQLKVLGGFLETQTLLSGNGANDSHLDLQGGGVFASNAVVIGDTSDSTATMNGSAILNATNQIELGQENGANGTLNMAENASIDTGQFIVGRRGAGIASLNGSSVVDASAVFLGAEENGTGEIFVNENAMMTIDSSLVMALVENSNALVRVQNNGKLVTGGGAFLASTDVDSAAQLEVFDDGIIQVGGDLFAGNVQGAATVNVGNPGSNSQLNVAGNASFGGSRSVTRLNIDGGQFMADNVFFDGFQPDLTDNQFNISGGTLGTNLNLEFQRGIIANLSGGNINVGNDFVVANDNSAQSDSVIINQDGGIVNVGQNFLFNGNSESVYGLNGGALNVAGDVQFGIADEGHNVEFVQSDGLFSVAGNYHNLGLQHQQIGGQSVIQGMMTVGDSNRSSFDAGALDVFGGTLDAQSIQILNGSASLGGGTIHATDFVAVGDSLEVDNFSTMTIFGGTLISQQLKIQAGAESASFVDLVGGDVMLNEIFIQSFDPESSASLLQDGGSLKVNRISIEGESALYGLLGGTLESLNQSLDVDGDLLITEDGEIIFKDGEVITVSGQFASFDAGGPGPSSGIFNLEQLFPPQTGDGYISLIEVGDNSNLRTGTALDDILLLQNFNAVRLDENDFFAMKTNGTLDFAAFALVEGTNVGQADTIGIVFANISAIPEPSSVLAICLMAPALALLRRNRRS